MRLAVPDLISNSYFPAAAADVLGFYESEGLELAHELIFPVDDCYRALRDGEIDFVGGSAHATLAGFPNFEGARIVAALAQGMYWFLIMRTDLNVARGDIESVKGRNIGAAPWVELGLKRLLTESGIDLEGDKVNIAPVPGSVQPGVSFGVTAAQALEDGKLDGFWANGMGAETAIRRGVGTLVLDVRRGDGPAACFNYTQPVLVAREDMIRDDPDTVAAAVRAIVKVQNALKADIGRATEVGEKIFSAADAAMIGDVVARDLPFYSAAVTEEFVAGMNRFAVDMGLMESELPYERIVATQFSALWT
jgi:ABC-type nitrate/sulfonate/bicarbonate transport system substrate-binding protein